MQRIRSAILGFVVVTVAAACGASQASVSPSTAAGSAVPSLAPVTSAAPSPVVASSADALTIALKEWSVTVPTTIKAGNATFTISNDGTTAHELLVFKSALAPAAYPTDSAGDIIEDGSGVTLVSDGENIDPGGTQTRTVDLAEPGTYVFVCNIAGHFKQGMLSLIHI